MITSYFFNEESIIYSLINIPSVINVIFVSRDVQSSNLILYPINPPNLVPFSYEHLSAKVIAATLLG